MQFSCVVLPLVLILTEFLLNVLSKQASQAFLNEHGIIATIDGYVPQCQGCVVFKKDSLLIYGTMHVPKEKKYLLERGGKFFVELCGGYPWEPPCSAYQQNWYNYCGISEEFLLGCNSTRDDAWYAKDCYCDDTDPMRWYSLIFAFHFWREDMVARIVFLENTPFPGPRYPLVARSTLNFTEIFRRGHIVYPDKSKPGFKPSIRLNGSTSWTPDFVLEMTSVTLVFSAVGFISN